MADQMQVKHEQGFARITVTGTFVEADTLACQQAILRASEEMGIYRALWDLTGATAGLNLIEIDAIPQRVWDAGIDGAYRIAVIYAKDARKFQHLENVAALRGLPLRVFTDERTALQWLALPAPHRVAGVRSDAAIPRS